MLKRRRNRQDGETAGRWTLTTNSMDGCELFLGVLRLLLIEDDKLPFANIIHFLDYFLSRIDTTVLLNLKGVVARDRFIGYIA